VPKNTTSPNMSLRSQLCEGTSPPQPAEPSKVLLPDLARAIAAQTGKPAPTYSQLWKMVVDGLLPAQKIRGRYLVDVGIAIETLRVPAAA
jgi:hypothetical protein